MIAFRTKVCAMVAATLIGGAANAQRIEVIVNGSNVDFHGQRPIMSGDRVLVPLRGVLEQMGAHVEWDPETQTVRAHRDQTDVELRIGQNTASVNHQPINLDVPAQIINGSTMVPLRFIGEALGEHVRWDSSSNTVDIENGGDYSFQNNGRNPVRDNRDRISKNDDRNRPVIASPQPQPRQERAMVFTAGSVIPVSLNDNLDSDYNRKGDKFSANVLDSNGFPSGTKVEGVVEGAARQNGDTPGMLELRFNRVDYPDGSTYPISGTLIDLNDKTLEHRGDHLWAKKPDPTNNRAVFAGYGAGAGLILGLVTHKPVETAALGGLLGFLAGTATKTQPSEVHLKQGTQFGVHLVQDASFPR